MIWQFDFFSKLNAFKARRIISSKVNRDKNTVHAQKQFFRANVQDPYSVEHNLSASILPLISVYFTVHSVPIVISYKLKLDF